MSDVSEFYRPQKKASSLYDPASEQRTLSRHGELFILCPRCLYRTSPGTALVPGYHSGSTRGGKLLKKEFDATPCKTAHRHARARHRAVLLTTGDGDMQEELHVVSGLPEPQLILAEHPMHLGDRGNRCTGG